MINQDWVHEIDDIVKDRKKRLRIISLVDLVKDTYYKAGYSQAVMNNYNKLFDDPGFRERVTGDLDYIQKTLNSISKHLNITKDYVQRKVDSNAL